MPANRRPAAARARRSFVKSHGLTFVLLGLFLASLSGHAWFGWRDHQNELREHGAQAIDFGSYLASGAFIESVGENWESEFLQMLAFVYLGCFLIQRGSPESREFGKPAGSDEDPRRHRSAPDAPWPVRRGGVALVLYEHSLGLAFLLLYLVSFALHALGGHSAFNDEQLLHGHSAVSLAEYLGSARFWFESLQNWQSEFLAVGSLVFLTVYLRQRGSPQSKPVAAPHHDHGG